MKGTQKKHKTEAMSAEKTKETPGAGLHEDYDPSMPEAAHATYTRMAAAERLKEDEGLFAAYLERMRRIEVVRSSSARTDCASAFDFFFS